MPATCCSLSSSFLGHAALPLSRPRLFHGKRQRLKLHTHAGGAAVGELQPQQTPLALGVAAGAAGLRDVGCGAAQGFRAWGPVSLSDSRRPHWRGCKMSAAQVHAEAWGMAALHVPRAVTCPQWEPMWTARCLVGWCAPATQLSEQMAKSTAGAELDVAFPPGLPVCHCRRAHLTCSTSGPASFLLWALFTSLGRAAAPTCDSGTGDSGSPSQAASIDPDCKAAASGAARNSRSRHTLPAAPPSALAQGRHPAAPAAPAETLAHRRTPTPGRQLRPV